MTGLFENLFQMLFGFVYYYPPFMAFVWMSGALIFHLRWERGKASNYAEPPELPHYPMLSFLVPCFNEEDSIEETLFALAEHNYPNFEIIAINDGSSDTTSELLDQFLEEIPQLRVIHLVQNQGKAIALRTGALSANGEYLLGVDGDVMLDKNAGRWMVSHFLQSPRVAAVTGNPRIRTRSTLLGKIQVGEFSAIIGLIKRAQRIYGRVFTVSGAVVAFRRSALQRIGFWDPKMITEDIDVSWALQFDKWDIRFEPNALCWLLMPETLKGLWSQRLRWAQGGMEVFLKYSPQILSWKSRFMYLIFLDYVVSVFWAFSITSVFFLWLLGKFLPLPEVLMIPSLLPGNTGILIGVTCLTQFAFSLYIDSRYEKGLGQFFYWVIWYPIAYWILSTATTVAGVLKVIFRKRKKRAIWLSPDRGIHLMKQNSMTADRPARQKIRAQNPLIINQPGQQKLVSKTIFFLATLVFWCILIYLWLPILDVLNQFPDIKNFYGHIEVVESKHAALDALLFIVTFFGIIYVVTLWSIYRSVIYGKKRCRRSAAPLTDSDALSDFFKVPKENILVIQRSRKIMFYFNDAGAIKQINGEGATIYSGT